MEEEISILIVSRDEASVETYAGLLEKMGLRVLIATGVRHAKRILCSENIDIVISHHGIGKIDGARVLSLIQENSPDALLVLLTSYNAIPSAIDLLGQGALTYICHPPDEHELGAVVRKAVETVKLRRENTALNAELDRRYGFEGMVGSSEQMQRIFSVVRQVADSNTTILIEGESGTGKELLARSIHRLSKRARRPFVAVACAALSEGLLESELFGHRKGAFSDAHRDRIGRFQSADGGTLFLDEVCDIPLTAQAKLLRAIEEHEIVPVGANEPISVDIRLIAATSNDMDELVRSGAFREDLYFRLRVVTIKLPPLRERLTDIPLLIDHFIREFSSEYQKKIEGVEETVMRIFSNYHWPGNVRELRNCIESMIALAQGNKLTRKEIPPYISKSILENEQLGIEALVGRKLEAVEKELIIATLRAVGGNRRRAAEMLGIAERTLYRRLKVYRLLNGTNDYF